MVQTSVDICNNVNLDPEMCLRRGEGVSQRVWKENVILSFIDIFFLLFRNIYVVQTMYRKQQQILRLMFAIALGPFVA